VNAGASQVSLRGRDTQVDPGDTEYVADHAIQGSVMLLGNIEGD
jgi:hypothetical protein